MDPRELKFANAFNTIRGVGCATLRALQKHFVRFEDAWRASDGALQNASLDPSARAAILAYRPTVHPDRALETLVRENIWTLTEDDPYYPLLLKEIPNPPFLLYAKGERDTLTNIFSSSDENMPLTLGVVGTRKPTGYGISAAEHIVSELAANGVTIVSGLATGIDTKAHQTALDTKGRTIAILGSGMDPSSFFPSENRTLAERITKSNGLLLSEYAPGTPGAKEHFPQRNRIISGLSRGVLVVEANERSGALITARFALEHNRDVFAVPGSIFTPTSHGPLRLIQEGAKLVLSARDIFDEFGWAQENTASAVDESALPSDERLLLEILAEPLDVDAIKQKIQIPTSELIASLSLLELKGKIKNLGNDVYQKIV